MDNSGFIDDATIYAIMNEQVDDVKEIIRTKMTISPFGFPGKRTYSVKFKNNNDEIKYAKIPGDLYESTYIECHKSIN